MNTQNVSSNANDIASALISRALANEHAKVEKIKNIYDYFKLLGVKSALKKTKRGFKVSCKELIKKYIKELPTNTTNTDYLVTYKKFYKCYIFYSDELKLIEESIDEYKNHLYSRHFFSALLGYNREDYDD